MSEHILSLVTVSIEQKDGDATVRLSGEIDVSNVDDLRGVLERELSNELHHVYFVLGKLEYADSSAFNLFLSVHTTLARRQQTVVLVLPEDHHLRTPLRITGLDLVLPLASTVGQLDR